MATPTRAGFIQAHPEFANAGTAMLDAQLALVLTQVSDSFGDQYELAVYLRLADNLATSPWGRDARATTEATTGPSTYGIRFRQLAEANAVSASRLGSR